LFGSFVGKIVGDVTISHDEIEGLMAGLLCTDSPPVGKTRLTEWAREHAATLGLHYANELTRRKNRIAAYDQM
jgi:NADH dehydrogenase